jgi:hypothetical protein
MMAPPPCHRNHTTLASNTSGTCPSLVVMTMRAVPGYDVDTSGSQAKVIIMQDHHGQSAVCVFLLTVNDFCSVEETASTKYPRCQYMHVRTYGRSKSLNSGGQTLN